MKIIHRIRLDNPFSTIGMSRIFFATWDYMLQLGIVQATYFCTKICITVFCSRTGGGLRRSVRADLIYFSFCESIFHLLWMSKERPVQAVRCQRSEPKWNIGVARAIVVIDKGSTPQGRREGCSDEPVFISPLSRCELEIPLSMFSGLGNILWRAGARAATLQTILPSLIAILDYSIY